MPPVAADDFVEYRPSAEGVIPVVETAAFASSPAEPANSCLNWECYVGTHLPYVRVGGTHAAHSPTKQARQPDDPQNAGNDT